MFGIDDAALAIGASSLIGGGLNLLGQNKQQDNSQQAIMLAMQDYALKKRMAEQNYELSTASRTDSRGNRVYYVPGAGWKTENTPETQGLIKQSDAISGMRGRRELTTGADDYSRNFNRRLTEGSTANPLLDAMRFRYGAPSREGVVGADKIAGVTGATEGADQARSGFAASALRTGMGSVPLGPTMASLDKGATQGIRTSLARSDANANPLYEGMLSKFYEGRMNPYNTMATRASNPDGSGFQPENISGGVDSNLLNSSAVGANTASRGMAGMAGAANPVIAAMIGQRQPNYDTFAIGAGQLLSGWLAGQKNKTKADPRDVYTSSWGDGGI